MSIGVPIKVLHEAEGHIVTCETNTGEVYRGKLIEAEDNMNCQVLKNSSSHKNHILLKSNTHLRCVVLSHATDCIYVVLWIRCPTLQWPIEMAECHSSSRSTFAAAKSAFSFCLTCWKTPPCWRAWKTKTKEQEPEEEKLLFSKLKVSLQTSYYYYYFFLIHYSICIHIVSFFCLQSQVLFSQINNLYCF